MALCSDGSIATAGYRLRACRGRPFASSFATVSPPPDTKRPSSRATAFEPELATSAVQGGVSTLKIRSQTGHASDARLRAISSIDCDLITPPLPSEICDRNRYRTIEIACASLGIIVSPYRLYCARCCYLSFPIEILLATQVAQLPDRAATQSVASSLYL